MFFVLLERIHLSFMMPDFLINSLHVGKFLHKHLYDRVVSNSTDCMEDMVDAVVSFRFVLVV
jgi:hypothetical protein